MPLSETVLILMGLLAIGMLAAGLFRKLPVPFTVVLVVIGMALGALGRNWAFLEPLNRFRLTPELVLFIFLPALIFESGLNLQARQLIKDIAPVLGLAVPALLFSTGVVGLGMWAILGIDLSLSLVFGALISATDPVAVVALFKELGTPQRLTVLVEGESLLNDATAIVLFNILVGIALYGDFSWRDSGIAAGEFLEVFLGGAFVGALLAAAGGSLMTRLKLTTAAILVLSLVTTYSSFAIAEHLLHLSGVMAVVGAALTLGVFTLPRLPPASGSALRETWEFLSLTCNTLLFLLVGLSVDLASLADHATAIGLAVVLVLAARACMIYTLVPAAVRAFALPRVTLGEKHIMWWGGLKGGLAIAIALSIPEEFHGRQLLLNLTLGVVLFTLLVNAPSIRPLIHWLGIDRFTDEERAEWSRGLSTARSHVSDTLDRFVDAGILSRANRHRVLEQALTSLRLRDSAVDDERAVARQQLEALRVELEQLEELYGVGLIHQYTYLDLRGELQRAREDLVAGELRNRPWTPHHRNPFLRLEAALIRRLREKNWAADLLATYQNMRLSRHLKKDVATIIMAEAALDSVRQRKGIAPEALKTLEKHYRERIARGRSHLAGVRRDYPDFFERFETRLSLQAALVGAMRQVEAQHHHGVIGAKAFTRIERAIAAALSGVPPISRPVPELTARDLITFVPLLSGLPDEALDEVARVATTVTFLAGDTIVGEGERGDALYVVMRGRVRVTHGNQTQEPSGKAVELGAGEFFGEMALLTGHIRTASVVALQPSTLLRLTRREVLSISERYQAVGERLEQARQQRTASPPNPAL